MRLRVRDWRLPALSGAAFLFARLSTGRLPYFLFYVITGILLLSLLWTWRILRGLTLRLQPARDRLEVGEDLDVLLEVNNRSLFPVPWLEVDDASASSLVHNPVPRQGTSLSPGDLEAIQWTVQARRRGHYRIGPVRVVAGDPFGLFQGEREVCSDQWVTVYPRIRPVEGFPVPLSQPYGPFRTRRQAFSDPAGLAGLRPYRPGDNPRHIHWKSSAHTGTLMLREFDPNAGTRVLLFPDLAAASYRRTAAEETVETVVEVTASLAAFCLHRQMECHLIAHAQERFETLPGRGKRALHDILEVLARVEAEGNLPMEKVLELETARLTGRCSITVISPLLVPRLADVLIELQRRHAVMLVLVQSGVAPKAAPEESRELARLLAASGVHVYLLPDRDAIPRLADHRLTVVPEVESR
ncbi:MAG TPA: DUF58 domain-containing protein [Symbiobacteriaceae bacterium]